MTGPFGAILDKIAASQDIHQDLDEALNHDLRRSCVRRNLYAVMQELHDVRDLVEDGAKALDAGSDGSTTHGGGVLLRNESTAEAALRAKALDAGSDGSTTHGGGALLRIGKKDMAYKIRVLWGKFSEYYTGLDRTFNVTYRMYCDIDCLTPRGAVIDGAFRAAEYAIQAAVGCRSVAPSWFPLCSRRRTS